MKTLLVRTGGLGDSLLTLPAAALIRQQHPDSELHLLGNGTMFAVARMTDLFQGFHSLDTGDFSGLYRLQKPSDHLRSFFSGYHTVYFFTSADNEQIVAQVVRAGAKFCHVIDPRPPKNYTNHISEHLMSMCPGQPLSHIDGGFFDRGEKDRHGITIHPGSGGIRKNWPLELYLSVAGKVNADVTFILGPAEIERGFEEKIAASGVNIMKPDSLEAALEVVSGSELYVGNDSGISHLASMSGTQTLALFGPTDPRVWRPLGKWVKVLSSADGSMTGICEDDVIQAINSLL